MPFQAPSDPTRLRILDLLRVRPRNVGELVEERAVSQPRVSKHLRVLREAGLVAVRSDARHRRYRLRVEPLADLDAWLAPYRELWNGRLDALERHLASLPRDSGGSGGSASTPTGPHTEEPAP
ncbi:transcriptional regulator [Marinitenerispora sediminis]|uniref:Transcriptional regulator n=1 Tax=Marinitenerispora sediminis TaxID=1931232 RepID=A0A368T722_9ACTN|nr:transcriptional regulator [Marinitenerispora sediminis]RCV56436.1 transcriptional regulator [Marinitenerispora sediminis]RCV59757.1 transcriptional regulator [Marinitenerispora sediminis]